MTDEKANVPKLRFPGFTDPWEQRRLNEYLEVSKEKNSSERFGRHDVLSVSGDCGIVNQIEFQGRSYAGASVSNYGVVHKGDVVYTKSPLRANPYGIIKANRGNDGIVSTLYAVYHPLGDTCSDFVQIYFEQNARMNNYMAPLVNKGAKNDMKVSAANALKGCVTFPGIAEQKVISALFRDLDSLITLHQRELDHLKLQKRGLLQKMFPKDGSNVPELRFPGFTDPWEQRRLGEVASFSKGFGYSKEDVAETGAPLFLYGRLYTAYQCVAQKVDTYAEPRPDSVFSSGNEVVTPSSGETAEDIAIASAVLSPGIMLGGGLNVILPHDCLDQIFLALSISHGRQHLDLAKRAQGKSIVHLYNADLSESAIAFPPLAEQRAIGALFRDLDSLITLHQRELDHLKLQKKALLQQMFV